MHRRALLVAVIVTSGCFNPELPDPMSAGTDSNGPDTTTTMAADESSTAVDTDPTSCEDGCDDQIPCTDDACVDGVCVNTPVDTMCDDGFDCTADRCDPAIGCAHATDDTLCDDGLDCTADRCDAAMGCIGTPDDALCDDGVPCTVETCGAKGCTSAPDDTRCDDGVGCTVDACDAALGCTSLPDDAACDLDGSACTRDACDPTLDCQVAESFVLVFNGSNGGSTAPEDAVASLGYSPIVVVDEAAFVAAFDAGNLSAIVFDVPSLFGTVPAAVQTRLDTWVDGGERLVFGFWNLGEDPTMASTLDVVVMASFDAPMPIHPDPGSPVDLFGMPETITPPLTYPDLYGDNGDQLVLDGPGFIAGRFNDAIAGPGAILVTHADHVVANGFIISEIGTSVVDSDEDGINDGEELLRNELTFVCGAP